MFLLFEPFSDSATCDLGLRGGTTMTTGRTALVMLTPNRHTGADLRQPFASRAVTMPRPA